MVQLNTTVAQAGKHHSIEWKVAAVLPPSFDTHLGLAGPVVGIHKEVLIIGGGANFPDKMPWFGGKKMHHDDIFVFLKDKNQKITLYDETFKLPFPIAYGASCTTAHGIVYAGGENKEGLSDKVLLIGWNELENEIDYTTLPNLPFGLANASISSIGNTIYIAGGESSDGISDLFWALDLDNISAGWQAMPRLPRKVSHSVMVSQSNGINDCIYMIGGRKENLGNISTLYSSIYQFEPKSNLWSQKTNLPYSLSAGTGVAVDKKSILLFGGDKGETFHKAESLIASINDETDSNKKEELNKEKINVQTNHLGFSQSVIQYNTHEDKCSVVGSIVFDVPVTTTAVVWGETIVIPSGEIKAGIRTPNILLGQLK